MSRLWWQLPGPSHYVSGVARAVRNGNHVVLALPEHLPEGLEGELREALGSSWPWHDVPSAPGAAPLDYLFDQFAPGVPVDVLRTPQVLVQQPRFRNRVLWLRIREEEHWRCWRPFLEDYRAACHGYAHGDHAQLLIAMEGRIALQPPDAETLLSIHPWQSVVSGLDAMLYAALLLRDRPFDHLPRQVAVATIAALSLWDPGVAERLAAEPNDLVQHPIEVLRDIAAARGWQAGQKAAWEYGQKDMFDGEPFCHSSFCLLEGDTDELNRRRWKAQVSVVFPFLEQRRRDLIEALRDKLYAPCTFQRNGYTRHVDTLEEFEFSDILEQMRGTSAVDLSFVRRLRDMRNALAHLETVDHEDLVFPFTYRIRQLRSP